MSNYDDSHTATKEGNMKLCFLRTSFNSLKHNTDHENIRQGIELPSIHPDLTLIHEQLLSTERIFLLDSILIYRNAWFIS